MSDPLAPLSLGSLITQMIEYINTELQEDREVNLIKMYKCLFKLSIYVRYDFEYI